MYYPDIQDENFQYKIANLVEFRYLDSPWNLFPYQEFVRRYMSPFTPYKFLILYHGLGSGKTVAAISVAIDHYIYSKKKAIVITRGGSAEANFKSQINKYMELSNNVVDPKIFTYYHYIQLSNIIRRSEDVGSILSNHVVFMDEVHNLKDMEKGGTLDSILSAINSAKNSKFLFSTGTPMINSSREIISLLSLAQRHIPINCNIDTLRKQLSGLISYSEISTNKPRENVIGNKIINNQVYYTSIMSDTQYKNYLAEKEKGIYNVYNSLINISLFCLPSGLSGRALQDECMEEAIVRYKTRGSVIKCRTYTFTQDYRKYLKGRLLAECSSVYKSVIDIVEKTKSGKIFIFLEYIKGSGIIVLNQILEEHGFQLYPGGDLHTMKKKKRYTFCTGDKELTPNINERLSMFNNDINDNGEYIQVLIGSKAIGESINVLNTKQFHFISHHWNISSLTQAKGRIIRENSHKTKNSTIDVYVHLSTIPTDDFYSIDEYKVMISHKKQSRIRLIENIMKEQAIDKYIYNSEIPCTDDISFISLYSRLYISTYIQDIFNIAEGGCKIEDFFSLLHYKELIIEIVRLIIINNLSVENRYLRCSYNTCYLTEDRTSPFYDFEQFVTYESSNIPIVNVTNMFEFVKWFRFMDIKNKINILENAIENSSSLLRFMPMLYVSEDNKFYHILYYKDLLQAYTASVYVPKKLEGKTRAYDGKEWKYVDNELSIFEKFKRKYSQEIHKICGYISVIDGKMRLRGKISKHNDRRKINRGIALNSMLLRDLEQVEDDLNIQRRAGKENKILGIEEFLIRNKLFCIA